MTGKFENHPPRSLAPQAAAQLTCHRGLNAVANGRVRSTAPDSSATSTLLPARTSRPFCAQPPLRRSQMSSMAHSRASVLLHHWMPEQGPSRYRYFPRSICRERGRWDPISSMPRREQSSDIGLCQVAPIHPAWRQRAFVGRHAPDAAIGQRVRNCHETRQAHKEEEAGGYLSESFASSARFKAALSKRTLSCGDKWSWKRARRA